MKPRHFLPILVAVTGSLHAQGPLTAPPGTPGPEMKSLQQIWDKIGGLETQVAQAQTQLGLVQAQNQALNAQLFTSNVNLPWQTTTVVSAGQVGEHCSLAFGPDGQPAIAFWDNDQKILRIARFDGSAWSTQTVDNSFNVGWYASLAFGPDGLPAVAYFDISNQNLKYAHLNGSTWDAVTVDSPGSVGQGASLKFAPNGQPTIAYCEPGNRVKFAQLTPSGWSVSIAIERACGNRCSLAYGPDGQPAIAFTDTVDEESGVGVLRYSGGAWSTSYPEGGINHSPSIAFGPDGKPYVSYDIREVGTLPRLRFASSPPAWTSLTFIYVDPAINVGTFSSLRFGFDGIRVRLSRKSLNGSELGR